MNAQSLPPLPKHFQGFVSDFDARAHCRRFGAAEIIEQRDDGLWWPKAFGSRDAAREHIAANAIVGGYAMGLRVNGATRWAVGIDKHATTPRTAPAQRSASEGDDTAPVATGTRKAGATFDCKRIAAERPDLLADKAAFVAACVVEGIHPKTAETQFYRIRKG